MTTPVRTVSLSGPLPSQAGGTFVYWFAGEDVRVVYNAPAGTDPADFATWPLTLTCESAYGGGILFSAAGVHAAPPSLQVTFNVPASATALLLPATTNLSLQNPPAGYAFPYPLNVWRTNFGDSTALASALLVLQPGSGLPLVPPPSIVTSGLLMQLALDEGFTGFGGTVARDSSGNGRNGTFGPGANAPAWTSQGLQFTNSWLILPASVWPLVQCVQLWCDFTPLQGTSFPTMLGADTLNVVSQWPDGMPTSFNPTSDLGNGTGMIPSQLLRGPNGIAWVLGSPETVFWNGAQALGYVNQGAAALPMALPASLFLGAEPTIGRPYIGQMYYVLFYGNQPTPAQLAQNAAAVNYLLSLRGVTVGNTVVPTSAQILTDGDSMTRGAKNTYRFDYPTQTVTPLTSNPMWTNLGLGGQTLATMITAAPGKIDPLVASYSGTPVLFIWGGTNDLGTAGNTHPTPAALYARMVSYCQARKVANPRLKVVVLDLLDRTQASTDNVNFTADRDSYNALLAADFPTSTSASHVYTGASYADYLIRLSQDATIGPDGAAANTTYFVDGIHQTDAGAAIVAGYARSVLSLVGIT